MKFTICGFGCNCCGNRYLGDDFTTETISGDPLVLLNRNEPTEADEKSVIRSISSLVPPPPRRGILKDQLRSSGQRSISIADHESPLDTKKVSVDSPEPKPHRVPPRKYRTLKQIDPPILETGPAAVITEPAGLYLTYHPKNNGTWQLAWNQSFIPDAWLFARPIDISKISEHQFKRRPQELMSGIHSSTEKLTSGIVEFIKVAFRHKAELRILEKFITARTESNLFPEIFIALHGVADQEIKLVRDEAVSLSNYDAAGCVIGSSRASSALAALVVPGQRVPTTKFVMDLNSPGGFATTFPLIAIKNNF